LLDKFIISKHLMIKQLGPVVSKFSEGNLTKERKVVLDVLVNYIKAKAAKNENVNLNFICTHNSRRSHLCQIWAQTMAYHFGIKDVHCYSGGTEATAMFPKVAETLMNQGFEILKLSESANPVYAVKYAENEAPLVCFSKTYDAAFNPQSLFGAIMTCNNADENCPIVSGAEVRIPIKYHDPKAYDGTELMDAKYAERSLEIGQEMFYVFRKVKA
jgi:arsenate reductase (thioredoxin)